MGYFQTYWYQTETLQKSWRIRIENGTQVIVRFGKIGAKGREITKTFSSPAQAKAKLQKMTCAKLAKGYKPLLLTVFDMVRRTPPVRNPRTIASVCLGHHASPAIADEVCLWATACIQNKMSPRQFKMVWDKLMDDEDENLSQAFSTGNESWLYDAEWDEDFDVVYAKAFKGGANIFTCLNTDEYYDIIAIRGNPGIDNIRKLVLGNHSQKNGKRPKKSRRGAPTQSVTNGKAKLKK